MCVVGHQCVSSCLGMKLLDWILIYFWIDPAGYLLLIFIASKLNSHFQYVSLSIVFLFCI